MTTSQALLLIRIMSRAESQRKGDYRVYESLKREIDKMNLSSTEYESAIQRLARKLRV